MATVPAFPPRWAGTGVVPLRVEPLRAEGNVAVRRRSGLPACARCASVEEVPEPCLRQKLFDPGAIGAFRQPAARRSDAEQSRCSPWPTASCSRMLSSRASSGRYPCVRGSDDLQQAALLEASKGGDQVPIDRSRNSACRRLKRDLPKNSTRARRTAALHRPAANAGRKTLHLLTKTGLTSWFARTA